MLALFLAAMSSSRSEDVTKSVCLLVVFFLAAMSSSRSDVVTQSVRPFVRSSFRPSVRHEGVFL